MNLYCKGCYSHPTSTWTTIIMTRYLGCAAVTLIPTYQVPVHSSEESLPGSLLLPSPYPSSKLWAAITKKGTCCAKLLLVVLLLPWVPPPWQVWGSNPSLLELQPTPLSPWSQTVSDPLLLRLHTFICQLHSQAESIRMEKYISGKYKPKENKVALFISDILE